VTKKRLRQRSKSITITVIPHEQSQGSERVEQDARSALIGADRGSDRVRPVVTLGNLIKNPHLDTSLQDRRCLKTSNDLHQPGDTDAGDVEVGTSLLTRSSDRRQVTWCLSSAVTAHLSLRQSSAVTKAPNCNTDRHPGKSLA
jgi:hypothetical protein